MVMVGRHTLKEGDVVSERKLEVSAGDALREAHEAIDTCSVAPCPPPDDGCDCDTAKAHAALDAAVAAARREAKNDTS